MSASCEAVVHERPEGRTTGADEQELDEISKQASVPVDTHSGRGWHLAREELLQAWASRVSAVEAGHFAMADRLTRENLRLGIPVVILSTMIGTSVFATLGEQVNLPVRIAVGLLSVAAAVLASLQTFLRLGERSEKHRVAAALYSALRRDIESVLATPRKERPDAEPLFERIKLQMKTYGKESPAIGEREWSRVQERFELSTGATVSQDQVERIELPGMDRS